MQHRARDQRGRQLRIVPPMRASLTSPPGYRETMATNALPIRPPHHSGRWYTPHGPRRRPRATAPPEHPCVAQLLFSIPAWTPGSAWPAVSVVLDVYKSLPHPCSGTQRGGSRVRRALMPGSSKAAGDCNARQEGVRDGGRGFLVANEHIPPCAGRFGVSWTETLGADPRTVQTRLDPRPALSAFNRQRRMHQKKTIIKWCLSFLTEKFPSRDGCMPIRQRLLVPTVPIRAQWGPSSPLGSTLAPPRDAGGSG